MSELSSRVASLKTEFRYLRLKERGPGCWLLRRPVALWNRKKGEEERDVFLSTLLKGMDGAAFASPAYLPSDELSWEIAPADSSLVKKHEDSELGEWILLLFVERPENPPLPALLPGIKCGDLQEVRKNAGAAIMILSLPDDREWIITVER